MITKLTQYSGDPSGQPGAFPLDSTVSVVACVQGLSSFQDSGGVLLYKWLSHFYTQDLECLFRLIFWYEILKIMSVSTNATSDWAVGIGDHIAFRYL